MRHVLVFCPDTHDLCCWLGFTHQVASYRTNSPWQNNVQVDYLHEDWVMKQQEQKSDVLASASASLFSIFHMSASYETKTDLKMLDSYRKQRTSSSVLTKGGPLFQPANFTPDSWAIEVDG